MENKKRIAIVSTYKYDSALTDMACAWYTVYTFIDVATGEIGSVSPCTGCGRKLSDEINAEVVPITDEIKAMYRETMRRQKEEAAAAAFERFTKEVDEYNSALRVQEKGQVVEITNGKHKGKVGRVAWIGKSKFNHGYGTTQRSWRASAILGMCIDRPYSIPSKDDDLVLVRAIGDWADGKDKVYVSIDACKVVEGFKPLVLDMDAVKRYNERQSSNIFLLRDAYDYVSYVD